jgi:hypothetical protein
MCTELLPPGGYPTAVNKMYIISYHMTQVFEPPYSLDLTLCDFWVFPKLKSPLKGRRFVNATVTQYTRSVNGVSLPTH